jgi:filamentous hemagglutinin
MFTGGDLYYYGYRFYDPNYQRWINQDPIGENGGINLYRAFGNAPTLLIDAFGLACETPWDAANLLMGIGSFAANASSGNVMGAFVDAGGIILDAGATAMPGAPGGAATLIKAGRAADKVNDWAKTGNKGRKVSEIPNRWKPGDDVYNPTRNGHPSEQTVRRREWMNEAQNPNRDDYTPTDFDRMKKGKPPERINPRTGERESMERSHEPVPKRDGGKQTQPRWPDEHGAVDPCRRLKK